MYLNHNYYRKTKKYNKIFNVHIYINTKKSYENSEFYSQLFVFKNTLTEKHNN